jgi:hypothetical protein
MKMLQAVLACAFATVVADSAYAGEASGLRQAFVLHAGERREVKPPGIEVTLRSLAADSGCLAADDCSAMLFRGTLVLRMGAHTEFHAIDALVGPDAPFNVNFTGFDLALGAVRPDAGGNLAATFTLLEPQGTQEASEHSTPIFIEPDGERVVAPETNAMPATAMMAPAPPRAVDRTDAQPSQATHIALRAADRNSALEPVPIWIEAKQASLSNSGWSLSFHAAVPLRKLEARRKGDSGWRDVPTLSGDAREYYGGFGFFDGDQAVIEARAIAPDGRLLGPYQLPFDALSSLREQDMRSLLDVPDSWVEVAKTYVMFSMFFECTCAIREVRYSVNDMKLDKRLALPPCSQRHHGELPSDDSEILRVDDTKFVAVQVVFHDGTLSPVKKVARTSER